MKITRPTLAAILLVSGGLALGGPTAQAAEPVSVAAPVAVPVVSVATPILEPIPTTTTAAPAPEASTPTTAAPKPKAPKVKAQAKAAPVATEDGQPCGDCVTESRRYVNESSPSGYVETDPGTAARNDLVEYTGPAAPTAPNPNYHPLPKYYEDGTPVSYGSPAWAN